MREVTTAFPDRNKIVRKICHRRHSAIALAIAAGLSVSVPASRAGVFTWNGGGTTDNFSDPANWGGTAPTNTGTATDSLIFDAGTTHLTASNDFVPPNLAGANTLPTSYQVSAVTFNANAGAYTIGGSPMSVAGNIANNSSNTQHFTGDIWLGAATATYSGASMTFDSYNAGSANRTLTNSISAGSLLSIGSLYLSTSSSGRQLIIAGTGDTTVTGSIADAPAVITGATNGRLSFTSTGTATLSGANSFTGLLTANTGTGVVIMAGSNSGAGGTTLTSGTLRLKSATPLSSGTFTINPTSPALATIQTSTVDSSISAATVLSGDVTVSGDHNLALSNTLTTSGANRTLTNNLDPGKLLTLSGGFIQSNNTSGRQLTIAGTGDTQLSGSMTDGATGATNGRLAITSAGTTTLSFSSNTISGPVAISAGTVQLDTNALGAGTSLNVLNLNGGDIRPINASRSFSNPVSVGGTTAVDGSQNLGFTGTFTNTGGNRTLNNNLTSGSLLTVSGNVFLSESTAAGRTFTLGGTGDTTISGPIANVNGVGLAGNLAVTSSGTTILSSSSNSYTGTTSITNGTLRVNGSIPSTAGVAVNATGTLGGIGTIAGTVSVAANGTISPGNSIGSLNVAAATIAGTLNVEYNGTSAGSIDLLNDSGSLDISAATVNFSQLGAAADDPAYVFVKYGTLTGAAFATISNLPANYAINYAYNDGTSSNNIALVSVPEPASLSLLAFSAAALFARRRRA